MRTLSWSAVALAVLLGAAPAARADHKGKVPWVEDPAVGMQKAKALGRPAMLFFSAEW